MDEHYTPSIEEFHVGFEYEQVMDAVWEKCEMHLLDLGRVNGRLSSLRVKHLDREDIELFDFEFIETNKMSYWYEMEFCGNRLPSSSYSFWKVFLRYDPERKIVKIEATVSNGDRETFFEGVIKNKSKLKEILTDIGILDGRE